MQRRIPKRFSVALTTAALAGIAMATSVPARDVHAAASIATDVTPTPLQPCNVAEFALGVGTMFVWSAVPNATYYTFKERGNGNAPVENDYDDIWFYKIFEYPGVYNWSVRSYGPDWVSPWSKECIYIVHQAA